MKITTFLDLKKDQKEAKWWLVNSTSGIKVFFKNFRIEGMGHKKGNYYECDVKK